MFFANCLPQFEMETFPNRNFEASLHLVCLLEILVCIYVCHIIDLSCDLSGGYLIGNRAYFISGKRRIIFAFYLELTRLSEYGFRGRRFIISDSDPSYASEIAGT